MYYYSSNYLMTITPPNPAAPFPPTRVANSGGTVVTTAWVYLQSITASAQAGIGYRQWIYVVPAGGCAACPNKAVNSVLILLCDAGLGLRVMQNVGFDYPTWNVNMIASTGTQTGGQANTVDVTGYVKAPNNDHALLGLMIQLVAGSTTALVTSATGNIYSFDVSSLSWNNGGYPVYSTGLGNVYRGIMAAPRPLDEPGTFCRSLPRNSQTAGGYDVQWPDGYVLAGSTTSGTWGSQNAPVYATASFGCYAGKWSTAFTTISCSLASGWPAPAPPACQNCAAAPGSYCPPNTRSAAGVPCPEGNYCTGGTAQPLFCLAPGGYYCPPGTAFNSPLGWAACPYGSTCAGGNAWPEAFNPIRRNSLLVVRVGDGVVNYGAGTQPVFIDEYDASTTPSSLLQTFAFPITANGAQQPFSLLPGQRGTAVTNGHLTLSADERFVTLAGFAAPPGTPISALRGPGVPRVIARMDWQGNIDTSTTTVLGDNSAVGSVTVFSIISACSYDGSGFVFTTDYVPNPANLSDGTPLLVNYQAFGTNVSSLAQVKTFSSPLALARSTSTIGAAFLGAAQPILGPQDGWNQCQYVENRLVISHTWGSVALSQPKALGDLSVANATGPITDANLDVDFSQRYTWSPSVKGAAGFAFFDNGQHLAICDRGNSIAIFADNGRGDKCMGSANETSALPNINYTTPTLSSAVTGLSSIIDTSRNCHSIAASRDGLGIFFTTDSQVRSLRRAAVCAPIVPQRRARVRSHSLACSLLSSVVTYPFAPRYAARLLAALPNRQLGARRRHGEARHAVDSVRRRALDARARARALAFARAPAAHLTISFLAAPPLPPRSAPPVATIGGTGLPARRSSTQTTTAAVWSTTTGTGSARRLRRRWRAFRRRRSSRRARPAPRATRSRAAVRPAPSASRTPSRPP
jgi:hypothetical protein